MYYIHKFIYTYIHTFNLKLLVISSSVLNICLIEQNIDDIYNDVHQH